MRALVPCIVLLHFCTARTTPTTLPGMLQPPIQSDGNQEHKNSDKNVVKVVTDYKSAENASPWEDEHLLGITPLRTSDAFNPPVAFVVGSQKPNKRDKTKSGKPEPNKKEATEPYKKEKANSNVEDKDSFGIYGTKPIKRYPTYGTPSLIPLIYDKFPTQFEWRKFRRPGYYDSSSDESDYIQKPNTKGRFRHRGMPLKYNSDPDSSELSEHQKQYYKKQIYNNPYGNKKKQGKYYKSARKSHFTDSSSEEYKNKNTKKGKQYQSKIENSGETIKLNIEPSKSNKNSLKKRLNKNNDNQKYAKDLQVLDNQRNFQNKKVNLMNDLQTFSLEQTSESTKSTPHINHEFKNDNKHLIFTESDNQIEGNTVNPLESELQNSTNINSTDYNENEKKNILEKLLNNKEPKLEINSEKVNKSFNLRSELESGEKSINKNNVPMKIQKGSSEWGLDKDSLKIDNLKEKSGNPEYNENRSILTSAELKNILRIIDDMEQDIDNLESSKDATGEYPEIQQEFTRRDQNKVFPDEKENSVSVSTDYKSLYEDGSQELVIPLTKVLNSTKKDYPFSENMKRISNSSYENYHNSSELKIDSNARDYVDDQESKPDFPADYFWVTEANTFSETPSNLLGRDSNQDSKSSDDNPYDTDTEYDPIQCENSAECENYTLAHGILSSIHDKDVEDKPLNSHDVTNMNDTTSEYRNDVTPVETTTHKYMEESNENSKTIYLNYNGATELNNSLVFDGKINKVYFLNESDRRASSLGEELPNKYLASDREHIMLLPKLEARHHKHQPKNEPKPNALFHQINWTPPVDNNNNQNFDARQLSRLKTIIPDFNRKTNEDAKPSEVTLHNIVRVQDTRNKVLSRIIGNNIDKLKNTNSDAKQNKKGESGSKTYNLSFLFNKR